MPPPFVVQAAIEPGVRLHSDDARLRLQRLATGLPSADTKRPLASLRTASLVDDTRARERRVPGCA